MGLVPRLAVDSGKKETVIRAEIDQVNSNWIELNFFLCTYLNKDMHMASIQILFLNDISIYKSLNASQVPIYEINGKNSIFNSC